MELFRHTSVVVMRCLSLADSVVWSFPCPGICIQDIDLSRSYKKCFYKTYKSDLRYQKYRAHGFIHLQAINHTTPTMANSKGTVLITGANGGLGLPLYRRF